jgi:branched-subunit amino acid ABC-type transport system permease component
MLVGFGLTLIFQNIALGLWTANDRRVIPSYAAETFTRLDVRFPYVRVAGLVISLVFLFALQQFFRKT